MKSLRWTICCPDTNGSEQRNGSRKGKNSPACRAYPDYPRNISPTRPAMKQKEKSVSFTLKTVNMIILQQRSHREALHLPHKHKGNLLFLLKQDANHRPLKQTRVSERLFDVHRSVAAFLCVQESTFLLFFMRVCFSWVTSDAAFVQLVGASPDMGLLGPRGIPSARRWGERMMDAFTNSLNRLSLL